MKNSCLYLLIGCVLFLACNTPPQISIEGNWVTGIQGQPGAQSGFTLKKDSTASSINAFTLQYEHWHRDGEMLILSGKSIGNRQTIDFSDTLHIDDVGDSTLTLTKRGGASTTYKKIADSAAAVLVKHDDVQCYQYTSGKDTVLLSLTNDGDVVSGSLKYSLYEKDGNDGTIKGVMKSDTLIADYTFHSEGKESVREVTFLKKGQAFIEGFGDSKEVNGKMIFRNKQALHYDGLVLSRITCN